MKLRVTLNRYEPSYNLLVTLLRISVVTLSGILSSIFEDKIRRARADRTSVVRLFYALLDIKCNT